MARRNTIGQPRWRIQSMRPDGTVWREALFDDASAAQSAFWALVHLSTEHVLLQHRAAGANRYVDLDRRGA